MINYKLIGTALLTIASVVGVREYLKPRDIESLLKWNGVNLISSKEGWESAFYENKEKLEGLGVKDADGLWKWCAERFSYGVADSSIVSSVEKYCQDAPKTIMGHIIRAGEKERLVKSDDNFATKVVYVLTKDRDRLLKLISVDKSQEHNYDLIGNKVHEWCNTEFKKKVKDPEHLGDVKRYCYDKKVKTVKDLLEKENLKPLTNTGEYQKKFKAELNRSTELIGEIKLVLKKKREAQLKDFEFRNRIYRYSPEKEEIEKRNMVPEDVSDEAIKKDDGQYFKWYCEAKYNEDLTGTSAFPGIYQRVKSRCTIR